MLIIVAMQVLEIDILPQPLINWNVVHHKRGLSDQLRKAKNRS